MAVAMLRDQLTAAQSFMDIKRRQKWISDAQNKDCAGLDSFRSTETFSASGERTGTAKGMRRGLARDTSWERSQEHSIEAGNQGWRTPGFGYLSLGKKHDKDRGKMDIGGVIKEKTVSAEYMSPQQDSSFMTTTAKNPTSTANHAAHTTRWPIWASPFFGVDIGRFLMAGLERIGDKGNGGRTPESRSGISNSSLNVKTLSGNLTHRPVGNIKSLIGGGKWRALTRGPPLVRRRHRSRGGSQSSLASSVRESSTVSLEIATSDLLHGDFSKIRFKYSEPTPGCPQNQEKKLPPVSQKSNPGEAQRSDSEMSELSLSDLKVAQQKTCLDNVTLTGKPPKSPSVRSYGQQATGRSRLGTKDSEMAQHIAQHMTHPDIARPPLPPQQRTERQHRGQTLQQQEGLGQHQERQTQPPPPPPQQQQQGQLQQQRQYQMQDESQHIEHKRSQQQRKHLQQCTKNQMNLKFANIGDNFPSFLDSMMSKSPIIEFKGKSNSVIGPSEMVSEIAVPLDTPIDREDSTEKKNKSPLTTPSDEDPISKELMSQIREVSNKMCYKQREEEANTDANSGKRKRSNVEHMEAMSLSIPSLGTFVQTPTVKHKSLEATGERNELNYFGYKDINDKDDKSPNPRKQGFRKAGKAKVVKENKKSEKGLRTSPGSKQSPTKSVFHASGTIHPSDLRKPRLTQHTHDKSHGGQLSDSQYLRHMTERRSLFSETDENASPVAGKARRRKAMKNHENKHKTSSPLNKISGRFCERKNRSQSGERRAEKKKTWLCKGQSEGAKYDRNAQNRSLANDSSSDRFHNDACERAKEVIHFTSSPTATSTLGEATCPWTGHRLEAISELSGELHSSPCRFTVTSTAGSDAERQATKTPMSEFLTHQSPTENTIKRKAKLSIDFNGSKMDHNKSSHVFTANSFSEKTHEDLNCVDIKGSICKKEEKKDFEQKTLSSSPSRHNKETRLQSITSCPKRDHSSPYHWEIMDALQQRGYNQQAVRHYQKHHNTLKQSGGLENKQSVNYCNTVASSSGSSEQKKKSHDINISEVGNYLHIAESLTPGPNFTSKKSNGCPNVKHLSADEESQPEGQVREKHGKVDNGLNRADSSSNEAAQSLESAGNIELTMHSHQIKAGILPQRSVSVCAQASESPSPGLQSFVSRLSDSPPFGANNGAPAEANKKAFLSKTGVRQHSETSKQDRVLKNFLNFRQLSKNQAQCEKVGNISFSSSVSSSPHPRTESRLQETITLFPILRCTNRKDASHTTSQDKPKEVTKVYSPTEFSKLKSSFLNIYDRCESDLNTYKGNSISPPKTTEDTLSQFLNSPFSDVFGLSSSNTDHRVREKPKFPARMTQLEENVALTPGGNTAAREGETVPKLSVCSPHACRLHGSDVRNCLGENRPVQEKLTHQQYAGYCFFKKVEAENSSGTAGRGNAPACSGDKGSAASWDKTNAASKGNIIKNYLISNRSKTRNATEMKRPTLSETGAAQNQIGAKDRTKCAKLETEQIQQCSPKNTQRVSESENIQTNSERKMSNYNELSTAGLMKQNALITTPSHLFGTPDTSTTAAAAKEPQKLTKREMMRQIKEKIKQEGHAGRVLKEGQTRTTLMKNPPCGASGMCSQKTSAQGSNNGARNSSFLRAKIGSECKEKRSGAQNRKRNIGATSIRTFSRAKEGAISLQNENEQNAEQKEPVPPNKKFHFGKLRSPEAPPENVLSAPNKLSSPCDQLEHAEGWQFRLRDSLQVDSNCHAFPSMAISNHVTGGKPTKVTSFLTPNRNKPNKQSTQSFENNTASIITTHAEMPLFNGRPTRVNPGSISKSKLSKNQSHSKDNLQSQDQKEENIDNGGIEKKTTLHHLDSTSWPKGIQIKGASLRAVSDPPNNSKEKSDGGSKHLKAPFATASQGAEKIKYSLTANHQPQPAGKDKTSVVGPQLKTLARSQARMKQNLPMHRFEAHSKENSRTTAQDGSKYSTLEDQKSVIETIPILHKEQREKNRRLELKCTKNNDKDKEHVEAELSNMRVPKTDDGPEMKAHSKEHFVLEATVAPQRLISRSAKGAKRSDLEDRDSQQFPAPEDFDPLLIEQRQRKRLHETKMSNFKGEKRFPIVFKENKLRHCEDKTEIDRYKQSGPLSSTGKPAMTNPVQSPPLDNLNYSDETTQNFIEDNLREGNIMLKCREIDCPETKSYRKTKFSWSISPERLAVQHGHRPSEKINPTGKVDGGLSRSKLAGIMVGETEKLGVAHRRRISDLPQINPRKPHISPFVQNVGADTFSGKATAFSASNEPSLANYVGDMREKAEDNQESLKHSIPDLPEITSEEAERCRLPDTLPDMLGNTDVSEMTSTARLDSSLLSKGEKLKKLSTAASRHAQSTVGKHLSLHGKQPQSTVNSSRETNMSHFKNRRKATNNQYTLATKNTHNDVVGGVGKKNPKNLIGGSPVSIEYILGESDASLGGMETPADVSSSKQNLSDLAAAAFHKTATVTPGHGRDTRSSQLKSFHDDNKSFGKHREGQHVKGNSESLLGKTRAITRDVLLGNMLDSGEGTEMGVDLTGKPYVEQGAGMSREKTTDVTASEELTKSKSCSHSQSWSQSRRHKSAVEDSVTNTLERLVRRRLVSGRSHTKFGGKSPKSASVNTTRSVLLESQTGAVVAAVGSHSEDIAPRNGLKKPWPRSRSLFASTGWAEHPGYVASAAHHSLRQRLSPVQQEHRPAGNATKAMELSQSDKVLIS